MDGTYVAFWKFVGAWCNTFCNVLHCPSPTLLSNIQSDVYVSGKPVFYYLSLGKLHLTINKKYFCVVLINTEFSRNAFSKIKGDYIFLLNIIWRNSTFWKKEIANHKTLNFCEVIQVPIFRKNSRWWVDVLIYFFFFLKSLVLNIVCKKSNEQYITLWHDI